MARTTKAASGANYMLALVVVLSFLFVIAVGCAIVIFNRSQDVNAELVTTRNNFAKFVTREERSTEAYSRLEASGDPTHSAYRKLNDEIIVLRRMITGQDSTSLAGIRAEIATLNMRDGQSLIAEIRAQRAEVDYQRNALNDERAKSQTAEANVKKVTEDLIAERATNASTINELRDALNKLQQNYVASQTATDSTTKQIEAQFNKVREDTRTEVTKLNKELETKDTEIRNMQARIRDLQSDRNSVQKGTPRVRPEFNVDGEITSIIEEDSRNRFDGKSGLVYINRGRKDRIVPGMTFEVFDRRTGVAADPNDRDRIRGKATIEVMNVSEDASVARVVRTESGQVVVPGDVIANVVYDPNMKFKFVVFGDFDIDNVGVATSRDKDRVETMIKEWGGIVTDLRDTSGQPGGTPVASALSYDTDFLVLGIRPTMPREVAGEVDPVELARINERRKKVEAYDQLQAKAVSMQIPILNQNRFLQLVGYYRR